MKNEHPFAKKRALKSAFDFILNRINSGELQPGNRIAPVAHLAEMAGVSKSSMWTVVKELKHQGVLKAVARHYLAVAQLPDLKIQDNWKSVAADISVACSADRIKAQLQKDIFAGIFAAGRQLPSIKELQARYATSYETLRTVLSDLASRHIIEPHKRGYRVSAPVLKAQSSARIVIIGSQDKSLQPRLQLGLYDESLHRALQSVCSKANIILDTIIFGHDVDTDERYFMDTTGRRFNMLLDDDTILGYLFMALFVPESIREDDIFIRLAKFKKPVAILDQIGGWKLPAVAETSSLIRRFTMTVSREPAMQAARYLISLGHKKIAFISTEKFHATQWSQLRFDGLSQTYAQSDFVRAVRPVIAVPRPGLEMHYAAERQSFQKAYDRWKRRASPPHASLLDRYLSQCFAQAHGTAQIRDYLFPALDKLLSYKEITAWVCANSTLAVETLELLREKKIAVPRYLSLLSFDDTTETLQYDLTSYNFDIYSVVNTMLSYILRPSAFAFRVTGKTIHVNGALIVRSTTGPAR